MFKTIDLSHLSDAQARVRITAIERAITAAGGDARYDSFVDEPTDTAYVPEGLQHPELEPGIAVVDQSGKILELRNISPLPDALNHRLMFRRIHVLPLWQQTALKAMQTDAAIG